MWLRNETYANGLHLPVFARIFFLVSLPHRRSWGFVTLQGTSDRTCVVGLRTSEWEATSLYDVCEKNQCSKFWQHERNQFTSGTQGNNWLLLKHHTSLPLFTHGQLGRIHLWRIYLFNFRFLPLQLICTCHFVSILFHILLLIFLHICFPFPLFLLGFYNLTFFACSCIEVWLGSIRLQVRTYFSFLWFNPAVQLTMDSRCSIAVRFGFSFFPPRFSVNFCSLCLSFWLVFALFALWGFACRMRRFLFCIKMEKKIGLVTPFYFSVTKNY